MTVRLRQIFPPSTFNKPSVLVIVFAACFAFWLVDWWRTYNPAKGESNFVWDVMNYYGYLPAKFCNNGSFDFVKKVSGQYMLIAPDGREIPKTTYGMSIMYAPFFGLAYKIAEANGYEVDGFSEPFATCIHWGSILYVILGMVFLRKFLRRYFTEPVVAVTLAATLFGTMLFYYTYSLSELTHGYLFALFSFVLFLIPKWHERTTYATTVGMGLMLGLISLIRPTDVYIFLFFAFWNVRSLPDLRKQAIFFISRWKHLATTAVIAFALWVPQMLFWKARTGSYLYFSYPGERFFWTDPQVFNILFSYRKGWITYTPLVIAAVPGFFLIPRTIPASRWLFAGVTVAIVYVLSCWWDWFFGGCFGARGFCQSIAYLSVPIAAFISFAFEKVKRYFARVSIQLITALFVCSCICLNIGLSHQYMQHQVHYDSMSKAIYWRVLRTYKFDENYIYQFWKDLDPPDYQKMRSGEDRDQ